MEAPQPPRPGHLAPPDGFIAFRLDPAPVAEEVDVAAELRALSLPTAMVTVRLAVVLAFSDNATFTLWTTGMTAAMCGQATAGPRARLACRGHRRRRLSVAGNMLDIGTVTTV